MPPNLISQTTLPIVAPPPSPPPTLQRQTDAGIASLPATATPSPFHITGVVLNAITRSPVPNAKLTASLTTTSSGDRRSRRQGSVPSDPVTADAEGRFDVEVPSAGGWRLTAEARGYRTQALDAHGNFSTGVVLTQAAPRYDLTFPLTPASVIEGFILDEAGEAVRNAQVALIYLQPPAPDNQQARSQVRSRQTTDDRGFYKFGGLGPGSYQIRVTAEPWYATSSLRSGIRQSAVADFASSLPDPLDVVYPALWFPGVTDPSAATPITLLGGETQEANLRLLPVPGSHLHIAGRANQQADAAGNAPDGSFLRQLPQTNIYLSRLMPDGNEDTQAPSQIDGRGNTDIAGLSPGTYLVHKQVPGSREVVLSTLQVGAGSPRTLDLSQATPTATVTVKLDPDADLDSLQISFRSLDTGQILYAQRFLESARTEIRRRRQNQPEAPSESPQDPPLRPDRTVNLLPGKYEVTLNGGGDLHLASIEAATGATATGRTVSIGTGPAKLLLHTASGRGSVAGVVNFKGHPDPGAMVLLIPATLGNPSGIDLPSRDQSNTDGSFVMSGLIPGGYILLAIDHGWDVNWSDTATFRRFLVHGLPLDLKPGSDLSQAIEAQSP